MVLQLPPLLLEMMDDGRWKHPGTDAMMQIAPFIRGELQFRASQYLIPTGECLMGPEEHENRIFHEYRGSKIAETRDLPWIDVEKSALIAINQIPGDDVALALDYRTSMTAPRVIGTEWIDGPDGGCFWREVAPSFAELARMIAESNQSQNKSE